MLDQIANARRIELDLQTRRIQHRMEWEELLRIENLERALRAAKSRLSVLSTHAAPLQRSGPAEKRARSECTRSSHRFLFILSEA